MNETFTPIQKRPTSGIRPYQSPHLKDANFIRKIAHSKEEESNLRKKKLFFHFLGFIFCFIILNVTQFRNFFEFFGFSKFVFYFLGYLGLILYFCFLLLYIYVMISKSKSYTSIKRPEKLPFSDSDIKSMTPKQISLLGLDHSEIQEYLNKKIEKSKITPEIKKEQPSFQTIEDDDLFFSSLRKKPQTSFRYGTSPQRRIEDSNKKISNYSNEKKDQSFFDYESPISNERDLEKYLKKYKFDHPTSSKEGKINFTPNYEQTMSYRLSPIPKSVVQQSSFDYGNYNEKAAKVLEEFGISGIDMSQYIERMRRWMFDRILKPIIDNIDDVNKQLKEHNYEGYDCYHLLDSSPPLGLYIPPNTPLPTSGKLTLRHILQHQSQGNTIITNRILLEEYLDIPNCNRRYLIERLHDLSSGGYLPRFKWNSGGEFNSHPWNDKDLPTDSQILLHLFCKYFDLSLPSHPLYGQISFTQRHFIDQTIDNKLMGKSGIYIAQTKKYPPHFNVIFSSKTLEAQSGRNNLFYVLVLFVYLIKTKFNGYLDSLQISDSSIDLEHIFQ